MVSELVDVVGLAGCIPLSADSLDLGIEFVMSGRGSSTKRIKSRGLGLGFEPDFSAPE